MSLTSTHSDMATHSPPSLPSFAQTFGTPSLDRLAEMSNNSNSLPPIHHRASSPDPSAQVTSSASHQESSKPPSKKRLHSEAVATDKGTMAESEYVHTSPVGCIISYPDYLLRSFCVAQ